MKLHGIFIVVFSCLFSLISLSAHANGPIAGWGRVNMQGAIIDTACAISVDSREQTIDMGSVPLSEVIRDGQGRTKSFSIQLINCVLERSRKEDWKQFQVTFDGDSEGSLFGVYGDATGVALQIIDNEGNIAFPGKALPLKSITPGSKRLNYKMKLVTNSQVMKAGDFFSSIRFKLDYF